MPASWVDTHDEASEVELDAAIDQQLSKRLGVVQTSGQPAVEDVRQQNRATLIAELERVRKVVRAWLSKPGRKAMPEWNLPSDQIVRKVVAVWKKATSQVLQAFFAFLKRVKAIGALGLREKFLEPSRDARSSVQW